MDTKELVLKTAQLALDKKAENLVVLDLTDQDAFTDYFLIVSAHSDRQVQAIADSITEGLSALKVRPLSVEGIQEGRWILIDFGPVVVHLFLDAIRDFYDLESLWKKAKRMPVPTALYGHAP